MKNKRTHFFTKILIDGMLMIGAAALMTIFWWSKFLKNYYHYDDTFYPVFLTMLLLSGVSAMYFLWQLRIMYKAFIAGNPFVLQTVTCLNKCAVCGGIIAFIFLIKEIMVFTFASLIILIVFILAFLFALTLRDLFKEAIRYKEENEGTI